MKDFQTPSRWLTACGVIAVFALFCVAPARTQTLDNTFGGLSESSDEPIDIESDVLTIYPEDHATFSGNVKAVQGTTTLRAREIKVNYAGGGKGAADDSEPVERKTAAAGKEQGETRGSATEESGGSPARKEPVNSRGSAPGTEGSGGAAASTEESGPVAADKSGAEPAALTESPNARSAENAQSTKAIGEPINIVSDWLLVNDKEKYAEFKGNVKFRQGATKLRAKEFKVSYAGSEDLSATSQVSGGAAQITKIVASGDVRALFMPSGSAKKKPAGAPAETKAEVANAEVAKPKDSKTEDTMAQDAARGGGVETARAANEAAGAAQTKPSSDKPAPAVTSRQRPVSAAQPTAARGDAASVAREGSERNDNRGITKIEATGDVVITGEKNETTTSDWLVYDLPLQWVTIGGNVVLSQDQNVLKGDRLVIDLQTGESRFENTGTAASGGGRVRALFQPKDAGDKPDKAKVKEGGGGAATSQAPQ